MHAERALDESARLELPKELLAEMNRRGSPRKDDAFYRVEAWKPSLLGRITELLAGRRRR